jgi:apolipoprotein N-acyltransferase
MKALVFAILSGLLLTAGFPKPEMYYVSWFALVPLLLALQGKTGKQALLIGYLCGLVHFFTVLLWIRHAVYHYGGLPDVLAILVQFLLCVILAPYPAVFALIAAKWQRSPFLWVFGLPFVWVTMEWLRIFTPFSGFPWASIGYSQSPLNMLIQAADITGVYGISWLVVFANTVISGLVLNFYRRVGVPVLACCIVAALIYGSVRIDEIRKRQGTAAPLTVSVIQGNIAQSEKWDPAIVGETLKRYSQYSLEAVKADPSTDILFWPESAMPFFYGLDEEPTSELNSIIKTIGKPVLFGSDGVTRIDGKARLLNRAYLVDKNADIKGAYAKQHLVPFGEYVPFSQILFFVRHLVTGDVEFVPGSQPGPVFLGDRPLGVLICYEVIFPGISRETVLRGSEVLMNMTNDAWYGDTGGPYQHFEMSKWRAIESRVPLVRSANTGISGVFDATGNELGRLALNTGGSLTRTIHPMRSSSFYTRFGDIFAWFSIIITICGLLYGSIYANTKRRI